MRQGLNKVLLIGHVADVPETRETSTGRSVTSFTLAIPRDASTNAERKRDDIEWLNVVVWDRLSKAFSPRLSQGRHLYVEGKLHTRRWEDAGGTPFFRTEVVASELMLLEEK